MEIERKWLLRTVPMRPADSKYWVDQFYLSVNPEVRLRRCVPNGDYPPKVPYRIAIKGDGSLSRKEIQCEVDEDFYEQVLDYVNLEPIKKHYLEYNIDGHEIGIAVILNDEKFIYAEVEFDSEQEALDYKFPWPELVIKEVTDDPQWKMKNYWSKIRLNNN